MKKFLFIFTLPLLLSGCGTLLTMESKEPFSGTQRNIDVLTECREFGCHLRPVAIIDFPLSLVSDILMLPVKGIQNAVSEE